MKRTVLIVDDHAGFRASARRVLESEGYSVIAEAADGSSGVTAAAESRPDLALVDVQLPDFDGFEVTRILRESERVPEIVLISSRDRSRLRLPDRLERCPRLRLQGRPLRRRPGGAVAVRGLHVRLAALPSSSSAGC